MVDKFLGVITVNLSGAHWKSITLEFSFQKTIRKIISFFLV